MGRRRHVEVRAGRLSDGPSMAVEAEVVVLDPGSQPVQVVLSMPIRELSVELMAPVVRDP
jgi:hypothetical protein